VARERPVSLLGAGAWEQDATLLFILLKAVGASLRM